MSTPKNLVIVESPAKAKTIEKFLGKDYRVMSSYGHIRDLKKKTFSIDVDNDFNPIYEIPDDKAALVSELRKAAKGAETVWLASDEDREGEAIAWHLYEVLGLKPENTRRIVFHEITKSAILNAIANPRTIDLARVDAQQARRVLDRIVGFELSPVLWKRLKPALSAGRVQSVAVRLIVEREKEIRAFTSEPYFRVTAEFTVAGGATLKAELHRRLPSEAEAMAFLESCRKAAFTVSDVTVKPLHKSPAPPFTTSTLQQEASRKLGFSVSQTMMVAQRLYENGHITYMRTDSLNLSAEAIAAISDNIRENAGERYLKVRHYHTHSKGAQEAHEAIRPTYIQHETLEEGTAQEKRLYQLIWRRAVASQMADAEIEKTTATIANNANGELFAATGERTVFDGFLRLYSEGTDDDAAGDGGGAHQLPRIEPGMSLVCSGIEATQRFTQQPPRYTEASLVKKMEELGIGRPSTYAPTISTIQSREYVVRGEHEGTQRYYDVLTLGADGEIAKRTATEMTGSDKGRLVPTDTGMIVNDFLETYFPDIVDYNFTARVEERFDRIAQGELLWNKEISQFYTAFHPEVDGALAIGPGPKFGERELGTDPTSGEPVSVKIGRFGPVVQIGTTDGDEKPRFASLQEGQSMADITLAEALKLFEYPRHLGNYEGKEVTVAIGRFGPYVRHDNKFVSLPKDQSPAELTLGQAIDLINDKRAAEAQKTVKVFGDEADTRILNGRYGVYIARGKKNYKIPKSVTDASELTFEDVEKIIAEADAAPAKPRTSRARKQK